MPVIDGEYIKRAMALQLKDRLPEIVRYREGQTQNFKRESVVIHQLMMQQNKRMENRFVRDYRMRLHYFPTRPNNNPKEDCDRRGNDLAEIYTLLELPGYPVRGENIEFEISDDTLHFNVDFRICADLELPPLPLQEQLFSDINIIESN